MLCTQLWSEWTSHVEAELSDPVRVKVNTSFGYFVCASVLQIGLEHLVHDAFAKRVAVRLA